MSLPFLAPLLLLLLSTSRPIDAATSDLRISEFLASNSEGLEDEDGDSSDWIEIHNTHPTDPVDLGGLGLTDDDSKPDKWTFPSPTILNGDSYLVVFASNKERAVAGAELHTNFKLKADGEYVGLYDENGMVLSDYPDPFPKQTADRILRLASGLGTEDSGRFFNWDGTEIPW